MRQEVRVCHDTNHDFPAYFPVPDEKMSHDSRVGLLVIGFDAVLLHPFRDTADEGGIKGRFEQAVFAGDDSMAVRREKAEYGAPGGVGAAWNLCLIPIAVRLRGGKNRTAGNGKLPDSFEVFLHPTLFDSKLRLISDVTEQTAAAF